MSTDLIGVLDAAAILGVHRTTVWRLLQDGELSSVPVRGAKGSVFERSEVEALRERRAQVRKAS
jgi:excisionase family DNA binding protein